MEKSVELGGREVTETIHHSMHVELCDVTPAGFHDVMLAFKTIKRAVCIVFVAGLCCSIRAVQERCFEGLQSCVVGWEVFEEGVGGC